MNRLRFDPKFILDIATLTGAIAVALGDCVAGVFTNCNNIWTHIHAAGSETGDRVWRMPLFKHYSDQMTGNKKNKQHKTDTYTKFYSLLNFSEHDGYDLNNLGKGKGGGSCTAAAFLREFVPKNLPWIHCDIAGVMGNCSDQSYTGNKGMSGRPMRTLVEFIERHAGLK
jgi:cytosol aminopeptidase